ncbi:MAG: hypothetical protein KAR06_06945 [Deltaproteobacteria bacterium]|nr:hypothetical protein [Deltaproteobacteria bacterium]
MSTLGTNVLTLADWAKRRDPDGKVPAIVELLEQTNEILDDMLFMEGNLPTGHRTTVRTGLPTVAWRLFNQGVQPSKSTTAQIDESCGMLEAWSEVDKDLCELESDPASFRLSEAQAFIEAMNIEMAETIFYGNSNTSPEEFTGLAVRYSSLTAANGKNVINGGGSGSDNMSIWLIGWGANTCFGVFPKGSVAGLDHEDLGIVTVETTAGIAGSRMRAYQDRWVWKLGIALKDWRYVARICNIDTSALVTKTSAADLIELMIKAYHRIPSKKIGKFVWYMNSTCFQMLDIQRRDDVISGGGISYVDIDGKSVPSFRGFPIKICDALLETEATVA